jgi:hypothetical protein
MIDMETHSASRGAGVVEIALTVAAGADETWRQIGNFADAGRFIGLPSEITSGDGGLGSVREVGDAVTEKMVAQGERFYVYVQTRGPMSERGYHGCVAVEGDGNQCIIFYTLVYDVSGIDDSLQADEHARLVHRFRGAVEAMAESVLGRSDRTR